jgi:hypothetical protein
MNRMFFITFIITVFYPVLFAQTNVPCPNISVVGSSGIEEPFEPMPFKVLLSEEDKNLRLEYKWTVSRGVIIKGQGTSSIKVAPTRVSSQTITAKVEIKGLPQNCTSEFSAESMLAIDLIRQQYEIKSYFEEKKELDNSIKILTQNKDLLANFYLDFKNPISKQVNLRILRILNYFDLHKLAVKDRITFVIVKNVRDLNRIFYEFKEDEHIICTNCQIVKIIKATDFDLKKRRSLKSKKATSK